MRKGDVEELLSKLPAKIVSRTGIVHTIEDIVRLDESTLVFLDKFHMKGIIQLEDISQIRQVA